MRENRRSLFLRFICALQTLFVYSRQNAFTLKLFTHVFEDLPSTKTPILVVHAVQAYVSETKHKNSTAFSTCAGVVLHFIHGFFDSELAK